MVGNRYDGRRFRWKMRNSETGSPEMLLSFSSNGLIAKSKYRGRQAAEVGIIRFARGRISVLDRPQLEQMCCECYSVVRKESDRLLPHTLG